MDLQSQLQNNLFLILIVLVIIIVLIIITIKTFVYFQSLKIKKRIKKGLVGEQQAFKFLEKNNYKVLDAQVKLTHKFFIDGEEVAVDISPDYLVKKKRKRYLVEVKTGDSVGSMFTASTRRQVLEYALVNPYDGILLVNMIEKTIEEVEFSFKSRRMNFLQRIFS